MVMHCMKKKPVNFAVYASLAHTCNEKEENQEQGHRDQENQQAQPQRSRHKMTKIWKIRLSLKAMLKLGLQITRGWRRKEGAQIVQTYHRLKARLQKSRQIISFELERVQALLKTREVPLLKVSLNRCKKVNFFILLSMQTVQSFSQRQTFYTSLKLI